LLAQSQDAGIVEELLEQQNQVQFQQVIRFGFIDARITGAPAPGPEPGHAPLLTPEGLRKGLLEQYANDFTGIEYRPLSEDSLRYFVRTDSTGGDRIGFLLVRVDLQPVSIDLAGIRQYLLYQVTLTAGPLQAVGHWQKSTARVCVREEVATFVRRDVQDLVDDLAIDFFKGKGEM